MLMTLESSLDTFLGQLAEASTRETAWTVTAEHFRCFGIDGLVCLTCLPGALKGSPSKRDVMASVEAPVRHACEGATHDDSVFRDMTASPRPFVVSIGDTEAGPRGSRLADAAQAAGYGALLVVPVRCWVDQCPSGMILLSRENGSWLDRHVRNTGLALAHAATQALLRLRQLHEDDSLAVPALTGREREVLSLSARGLTTRDVGTALGISVSGVNFHIANACRKLGANNRTHATSLALAAGMISVQ
jgi:DNA-binding CsgD family transcriptional regulator